MSSVKTDQEELEVTVEVVPQTVNDIVYMSEEVTSSSSTEEGAEAENDQAVDFYDANPADPVYLTQLPLVLDESQTFVILPQSGKTDNVEYTITSEGYLKRLDEIEATCIYVCQICNYKCLSSQDLGSHVKMCRRSKDKYVCNVCGEIFERAQVLSHHFKTNHQKPLCNICGCQCDSKAALMCHYKTHVPKGFNCELCQAEYDNAVALDNHFKTHTTTLLYACNKCNAGFSSTSEISVHLRTVHSRERTRSEMGVLDGERVGRMRKMGKVKKN